MKVLYHTLETKLYIDMMTIDSILIQGLYNIYNNKKPNQSHSSLLKFHTTLTYLLDYSYSLPIV